MIKTIFALFIAAGSVLGQVQVVQTVGAYENAPSVAQWFFPSTGVSIKPGHLLLVEGSAAAGTTVKVAGWSGWQLATCTQPGSSVNSNPTTVGNEQLQVWYKVATSDQLPLAFSFSAAQARTNAVFREIAGEDPNVPIDYCWLAAHPETASTFPAPTAPAPNVGDLAITFVGALSDSGQHPAVAGSTFTALAGDETAGGWAIHDSVSAPSTDTTTSSAATFTFPASVQGGVVTGLIYVKAAGTGGFGEQAGIAYSTSTNTKAVAEGQSITLNFNRTVNLATSGAGTWSCTTNCTSTTFTAPSQVSPGVLYNGVVIAPPDSIFSVPTVNFPVSSYSTSWLANMHTVEPAAASFFWSGGAWGPQMIDSSTPLAPHSNWIYGCSECFPATPFPAPPVVTRMHEQGAFDDGSWSADTHEAFLNWQTGQIWSAYGGIGATADSGEEGATYNSNSLLPWDRPGSGSAGGVAYEPLLLTPDDFYFGVSHPFDIAFPEFTPGACGYGTLAWGAYGYQWPAAYTNNLCSKPDATGTAGSNSNGIATTPATAGLPGLGAWYRLSKAWCSTNLASYSGFQYQILAGACNRGFVLTDWSGGGQFAGHADTALQQDPAIMAAINAANTLLVSLWSNPVSQAADFEFIDVSSASSCASWSNCGYNSRVNPASPYLPNTPTYVQAIASDNGADQPITFNLAVLPVGVGTLHKYITVPAGTQGLTLSAFVTNAVNQGITWTKNTALSNGAATVSNLGAVTLPAGVNTVTFDYFVAASVQDPNAKTIVVVKTIPANSDGSIRIDNGSSVPVYTDSKGLNWIGDRALGLRAQTLMTNNATNWPAGAPDQHIWQTSTETVYYGAGDIDMGDFFVGANAKYKVTAMLNPDRPTGSGAPGTPLWGVTDSQYYSGTGYNFAGPTPVSANGSFGGWANWGLLSDINHRYTAATDYRYSFPALATNDGFIDVRVFTSIPNGIRHSASVAGLYLQPDATATPHWEIGSFTGSTITAAGTPLNLYLRDFYTGAGSYVSYANNRYAPLVSSDLAQDATWSIVQQGCVGSTVDPVKGVYTPPATVPATCMDVVEISNSAYAATANVTVRPAVTIPAAPAAPVTTGP